MRRLSRRYAISSIPTRILPPGPFPPHGEEPVGTVDLGIRVRDMMCRRDLVVGPVRRALAEHLAQAARQPERLLVALSQVELLVDTWPLGALIDDAVDRWRQGPDPAALAVLFRASEVVGAVLGWPRAVDRRWPLPDEAWMREQLPEGDAVIVPRGARDGAAAVAVALDLPVADPEWIELPAVRTVPGEGLLGAVDELVQGLTGGVFSAVRFSSVPAHDGGTQAARAALREASPLQAAYERYGDAGLVAGELVEFGSLLGKAGPGTKGERPQRTCDALILPTLTEDGKVSAVGCLVWDGPIRPMRVNPVAVRILELLDGARDAAAVASELGAEVPIIEQAFGQLVELGAASA